MYEYCELPEFFSASYPVAKSPHRCCECAAPILPGEKYGKFSGKWDREFSVFKQHLDCEAACVYIRDKFQGGECISFGDLWEFWQEYTEYEKKGEGQFRSIMASILRRERRLVEKSKRRLAA